MCLFRHFAVAVLYVWKSTWASERAFQAVSGICVGVFLSRALSVIPFDVLLSVKHGRTDALPLIWSSARLQKRTETDFVLSCSFLSLTKQRHVCFLQCFGCDWWFGSNYLLQDFLWVCVCIHLFWHLSNKCCGYAAAKPRSHFNRINCDVLHYHFFIGVDMLTSSEICVNTHMYSYAYSHTFTEICVNTYMCKQIHEILTLLFQKLFAITGCWFVFIAAIYQAFTDSEPV